MSDIDTGDTVFHSPSEEHWVVAYCRNGRVCCCGWPETLANESDCELVRKATADERQKLIEQLARIEGSRGSYARGELAKGDAL